MVSNYGDPSVFWTFTTFVYCYTYAIYCCLQAWISQYIELNLNTRKIMSNLSMGKGYPV